MYWNKDEYHFNIPYYSIIFHNIPILFDKNQTEWTWKTRNHHLKWFRCPTIQSVWRNTKVEWTSQELPPDLETGRPSCTYGEEHVSSIENPKTLFGSYFSPGWYSHYFADLSLGLKSISEIIHGFHGISWDFTGLQMVTIHNIWRILSRVLSALLMWIVAVHRPSQKKAAVSDLQIFIYYHLLVPSSTPIWSQWGWIKTYQHPFVHLRFCIFAGNVHKNH